MRELANGQMMLVFGDEEGIESSEGVILQEEYQRVPSLLKPFKRLKFYVEMLLIDLGLKSFSTGSYAVFDEPYAITE